MNKWLVVCLLLLPFYGQGQIITTFAGTGVGGYTGDGGPATSATMTLPASGVFDKYGNYFFVQNTHVVRKIAPDGIITTIAGTGIPGYNGDNISATQAKLHLPASVKVDSEGDVYISDSQNNRIRKVNRTTGIITTIAGTGVAGFSGDGGPATNAKINFAGEIYIDRLNNLFISDFSNFRVRKINPVGIISTYAGMGSSGHAGDGGPATNAQIAPSGLCMDTSGNLYIGDQQMGECRIVKVSSDGIISTYAGTVLNYVYNGDGLQATATNIAPSMLAINHKGELFFADRANHRLRKIDAIHTIYTVAGNGTAGFNGDDIDAINAELNQPVALAFDTCDNLYIADAGNNRIRKINFNPHCWPVNVTDTTNLHDVNIYPNPTTSELHISLVANSSCNIHYTIQSIVGATLQQGTLCGGDSTIPLQLPPGLYMVIIQDPSTNLRVVKKIIKV